MKIEQHFVVSRSPQVVWDFFGDVPAVAQCLPGATRSGVSEDGGYSGSISVKLGPIAATFEGRAELTRDDAAMAGTIEGRGVDRRGGNRGQVKLVYAVEPHERGTGVAIDADVNLSGAIAQFGRSGLISEMSSRLIDEFVACLEAKLDATPAEAEEIEAGEVGGLGLLLKSLWAWLRRLLGSTSR